MNFPEVIVLPRFEEQLRLLSEDLNICVSTAVLGDTQFKRPTDVLLQEESLWENRTGPGFNPHTVLITRADALLPKTQG